MLSGARVAARVVDREAGKLGEHRHGLLVVVAELLAVLLLGQVEVSERGALDQDRHPKEAVHRRVAVREAVGAWVFADVGQPQHRRMLDQLAQDAAPAREGPDRLAFGLVDPDREEALQLGSRVAENAERRVAGAGQLAGALEHAVEHHVDVELGQHAASDVEHPACGLIHQPRLAREDSR